MTDMYWVEDGLRRWNEEMELLYERDKKNSLDTRLRA